MRARSLLLLALAACSVPDKHFTGDGSVGDGNGSGISINDLPEALRTALCKHYVLCQQSPDMTTCLATHPADTTTFRVEVAAVIAGKALYDPVKAKQCLDALSAITCDYGSFEQTVVDTCSTVFTGMIADNGPCLDGIECKSQNCQRNDPTCDSQAACCVGSCGATTLQVPIGQSCIVPGTRCVSGAYCASSGACAAQITAENTPCTNSNACAPPLDCARDAAGNYTTCYRPAAHMAQCTTTGHSMPCIDERDYCDVFIGICTSNLGTGASCNGNNGARCVGYDYCDSMHICQSIPSVGESCATSQQCLDEARCTGAAGASMTCALPAPVNCTP